MLPLNQRIIVLQQMLQLLHASQISVLAISVMHIVCIPVLSLVEQTHRAYLLVDSVHELP